MDNLIHKAEHSLWLGIQEMAHKVCSSSNDPFDEFLTLGGNSTYVVGFIPDDNGNDEINDDNNNGGTDDAGGVTQQSQSLLSLFISKLEFAYTTQDEDHRSSRAGSSIRPRYGWRLYDGEGVTRQYNEGCFFRNLWV